MISWFPYAWFPYGRNSRERVATVVRVVLATRWNVYDSYNSVVEIGLSSISTRVATGEKRVVSRLCFNYGNRKTTACQQFCDNQGRQKVPIRRTVFAFLKLQPAACTIPGYEINLRQCQPYGNTTVTTIWKQA
jgi:hypothetical protein